MKSTLTYLFVLFFGNVFSQNFTSQSVQVSDTIEISFLYNVTIIFSHDMIGKPYFGSNLAIVDEMIDERTLMVKVDGAAMLERGASSIPNTNMTIKTTEGIFNFILTYKKEPARIFVMPEEYHPIFKYPVKEPLKLAEPLINDSTRMLSTFASLDKEKTYFDYLGLVDPKLRMKMQVTNIWVDETYHYFKVSIENQSSIPYDLNYIRYITTYGKYTFKQTSDTSTDMKAEFTNKPLEGVTIPASATFTFIFAVNKFTLDKNQYFNIKIGEINGARQVVVPVGRKDLFEAKPLTKLKDKY